MYALLDIAPQLGTPVVGLHPQCTCQATVNVHPPEVGLCLIQHLVAMWVQAVGEAAQRGGLAHAGLARE